MSKASTRTLIFELHLDGELFAEAFTLSDRYRARDQLDPEDRKASVVGHRWKGVGYSLND